MNVVFLVHGVGRHAAGWSGEPGTALETAMQLYPNCFPAGSRLRDYLKVVEIRYDDLFDTVLDRWRQLADALPAPGGASNWTAKVTQLLQKAGDDRNIFARFGGDVLLYWGFALVARAVRLRVDAVIASMIYEEHKAATDEGRDPPKFAVVAHSLGTAVAQDALYQLATGRWLDEQQNLGAEVREFAARTNLTAAQRRSLVRDLSGAAAPPPGSIAVDLDGLFLVSDTSPLLHRSPLYSELQIDGVYDCHAVWSVNHELDPIGVVGGAGAGPSRPDKKSVVVRHIHEANIHGFAHYLSHPAVHGEIFRLMIPAFSAACHQSARRLAEQPDWNGFGGKLATWPRQKRAQLEQKLTNAIVSGATVQKLRDAIENYFRAVGLL